MKEMPGSKMTGEEIVISGISGLFPNTENTRDLIRNLYNKVIIYFFIIQTNLDLTFIKIRTTEQLLAMKPAIWLDCMLIIDSIGYL